MPGPKIAPYGSWKSPITSDLIVSGSVGLSQPSYDGDDNYWIEMRPEEGGRNVIVRQTRSGETSDLLAQPFNARTRVHEYGGGDYLATQGAVYFSNFTDQRLYVLEGHNSPRPLTPESAMRYSDLVLDVERNRLIGVREDHSDASREPVNTIVSLDLDRDNSLGEVLLSGYDFYSNPRVSPDGKRLSWMSWKHPNMPWDGTELWVGDLAAEGKILDVKLVAGGQSESIFQPEWSPDGQLYFVSDKTNWWNIYRQNQQGEIEPVCPLEAEFGSPQWGFRMSSYAFAAADLIVCAFKQDGISQLATIDLNSRKLNRLSTGLTEINYVRANGNHALFLAGSPSLPSSIVTLDLTTEELRVLRRSNNLKIDTRYFSQPRAVEFPSHDGATSHAFFYPPKNPDYEAPEGELPPLLVKSHGGPTSAATTVLSLTIQYWTSRGIGVLDVNYGGSTGYGRAYRESLKGEWGVLDVQDCVNGALALVKVGEVDAGRLMITGGSAGGYTTLCALTFHDAFKAGASHYGVSDAELLAKETHKFESRYLDGLIGPYPEARDVYFERSPINFTDQLTCPVIFFQGLDDKVVPPNQAEAMVEAIKKKLIPVAYVAFPGEQHGFRQAKNIKRALDGELYFYSRVFGFDLGEPVEEVEIENLG